MKLTAMFEFVLIIGAVIFAIVAFNTDLNNNYNDGEYINSSEYSSKYEYSSGINRSISKIQTQIDKITDTDTGFFSKIGAGIIAIPYFVILFPKIAIEGIANVTGVITSMGTDFGLAPYLIGVGIILVSIFLVRKIVEFFQGREA